MIATEKLIALAAGELDGAEADAVDEHVLACDACASTLERLLAMGDAIRAVVRGAAIRLAVTPSLVADLEAAGLVTQTYRMAAGGSVDCTVRREDRYVASFLEADFHGVERVDFVKELPHGSVRIEDVTFDAEGGEIAWLESGEYLRSLPTATIRVRLLAVAEGRDRELGTYVYHHTAYGSANSAPSS